MASLNNQRIDLTYEGLIKTEDNAAIGEISKVLTDGAGNSTGISINNGGDITATGNVTASAFYGDGSNLTGISTADTLQAVTDNGSTTTNNITAASFIKSGGTSSQFLKADGSVDSSSYLTAYTETSTLNDVTTRGATTANSITVGGLTSAGIVYPSADGNSGQVIVTDGAGNLSFTDQSGGGTTPTLQEVTTQGATTTDSITVGGLTSAGLAYPSSDGSANQILVTDGAGTLSFQTVSGVSQTLDGVTTLGNTTTNSIVVGGLNIKGFVAGNGIFITEGATAGSSIGIGDDLVLGGLADTNTGISNVAIGGSALMRNTSGAQNVVLSNGMQHNTTGSRNVALAQSLTDNTTGSDNIAIGHQSLDSQTTANYNVGIGTQTLFSTTTSYNTGVGYRALYNNSTGEKNTSVGALSLNSNTTGIENVALGMQALYDNQVGDGNTGVGYFTMRQITGDYNTGIGHRTLDVTTSGTGNTALGEGAGGTNQTGSNNTFLGRDSRTAGTNFDNCIVIGYNAVGNASNTATYGSSSITKHTFEGGVIASPDTYTNTTANAANVYIDLTTSEFMRSTSSLKYKEDVRDYDKGLDVIDTLRPVYYKSKGGDATDYAGLIAEEIHEAGLGEFVQYDAEGQPDALAYQNMVALLIKGIQELRAEVELLKSK